MAVDGNGVRTLRRGSIAMQATRQGILDYLRLHDEATVRVLGAVLGLTATGVRQHLTILAQEGFVASREERGKVGRPALAYSLTERGEASYPMGYDLLAGALLDEVRSAYGTAGFQQLIRSVAQRMAEPHLQQLAGVSSEERVEAACELLRERGVVVDWELDGEVFLVYERTCPYPRIARQHPAACVIDVAYMTVLTGMDARLVRCRVRGDVGCAYRLQPVATR